jgi:flagellar hook-associated protein FlgK
MQVNVNSMMAHQDWITNNAHNVANVNSKDSNSTQTTIQNPNEGSVQAASTTTKSSTNLSQELAEQIPIEKAHEANARTINAYDEMIGSLIDLSV